MYIFRASAAAGRYVQQDVVVIMPIINEPGRMFTQANVENAAWDFSGQAELEYLSTAWVYNDNTRAIAQISATGREYFHMVFTPFADGGPWQNDYEQGTVISESLAWALFGSHDVVGLTVRIGDELYTIVGVAQDIAEATMDGFAWVPRSDMTYTGNIIYLRLSSYDPITAYLSATDMLTAMNHRPQDYIITDINVFIGNITMRAQILLAIAGVAVIFFTAKLTYRLARQSKTKTDWVVSAAAILAVVGVTAFILPHLSIDLWIPAFAGDGIIGYTQLIFNMGLLAPRQYLPGNLAALYDLNFRANVALGVGMAGFIGCVATYK